MSEVTSSAGMALVNISDYLSFIDTKHKSVRNILDGCKWGGESPLNSGNEFKYDSLATTQIGKVTQFPSLPSSLALPSLAGSIGHTSIYSDLMATSTGFIKADFSAPGYVNVNNTQLVLDQVESIIDLFKLQMQDHDLFRILWAKSNNKLVHVKAFSFQMLFYAFSNVWLKSKNSNICIERIFDESQKTMRLMFSSMGTKIVVNILDRNHFSGSNQLSLDSNTIYVLLNFECSAKTRLTNVTQISNKKVKFIEIDVSIDKFSCKDKSSESLWLDELCTEFEGVDYIDDHYTQEKRKGGANSYKNYKPLKDKVGEICKQELEKRHYRSALSLRNAVAIIIEEKHKELLDKFAPYMQTTRRGADWRQSTFYNWCKVVYKLSSINTKKA